MIDIDGLRNAIRLDHGSVMLEMGMALDELEKAREENEKLREVNQLLMVERDKLESRALHAETMLLKVDKLLDDILRRLNGTR